MASPYHVDLIVNFEEEGAAFHSNNIQTISDFQENLSELPDIVNQLSFIQHLDSARRALAGHDSPKLTELDESLVEQYYLAYQLSLPAGYSANEFVDIANQQVRISVLLRNMTSQRLRLLEEKISAIWGKQFATTGKLTITGESVPLAYVSQRSIAQVAKGVLSCILLVFIGTYLGTRDLRLSALSILAIVAPFTMSFGTWAWFGADFGLATSLVIAVTIGIIMDDTIHFIFRYQKGRRGLDLAEGSAIGYAIHHSGVGIISSSVILVAGFLVLSLSSFTVNRYFGLGVCLTISSALVFTLLALPPLIRGKQTSSTAI